MKIKLIWATPDPEQIISDLARVSAPANQGKAPSELLSYCVKNNHWSPFEMASACFEIDTTRDIARQILRHRSFSFQEFSQRYAAVGVLPDAPYREARMQDVSNRQNSVPTKDKSILDWWEQQQKLVRAVTEDAYRAALEQGIAKEVARAVLPEGLTTSRMYMSGTVRSWMHFCSLRSGNGTQLECQHIAQAISKEMEALLPKSWKALMDLDKPAVDLKVPALLRRSA